MNGAIVIQARMNSARMPGKVLSTIRGKLLLQHLLESIESIPSLPPVIVATSLSSSDDPIVEFCEKRSTNVFRGSLYNVASRFQSICKLESLDFFVRICADSPAIHPEIIQNAVNLFCTNEFDIVTNTLERSFPKGQSVEVVRSSVFLKSFCDDWNDHEKEHVTSYFYKRNTEYKIHNFFNSFDCSGISLSVDQPQDYETISQLFQELHFPHWNFPLNEFFKQIKK